MALCKYYLAKVKAYIGMYNVHTHQKYNLLVARGWKNDQASSFGHFLFNCQFKVWYDFKVTDIYTYDTFLCKENVLTSVLSKIQSLLKYLL